MDKRNIRKQLWVPSFFLITIALILPAYLALLTPSLGFGLKLSQDGEYLQVDKIYQSGANNNPLQKGDRIYSISDKAGRHKIKLDKQVIMEEPDMIVDYDDFNRFFAKQSEIYQLLQQDKVLLQTSKGQVEVTPQQRSLTELPFSFWFQIFCGIFSALTALAMYAFNRSSLATKSLWLTGISFYLVTLAAAPYSSRELVMNGMLFNILDNINHLGSLIFTAAFVSLFWYYPVEIKKIKSISVLYLLTSIYFIIWLIDILQLAGNNDTNLRWPVLLGLIGSILLAVIQWLNVRKKPVERAAMRWLFFSIIITGSFFVFTLIASSFLGVNLEISQAYSFGILTLMYLGLALGVSRYRLFQLETWWIRIWIWLMAGALVLLLDSFFVYLVHLNQSIALIAAFAFAGWFYFPLRQLLMSKLFHQQSVLNEQLLAGVVSIGAAWSDKEKFKKRIIKAIEQIYAPLKIVFNPERETDKVVVGEDGTTLSIPPINELPAIDIVMPDHGQRLFNNEDLKLSRQLFNLLQHVVDSQSSFYQGQSQERQRIYSDLHDDLGAKLLSLSYRVREPELADLSRSALQDLRDVVSRSGKESALLNDLIADWHAETDNRLEATGINLEWNQNKEFDDHIRSPVWALNLGRIIREAISNIIKHTDTQKVAVNIGGSNQYYTITIEDFGSHKISPESFNGRGTHSMQVRTKKMGGKIKWQAKDRGGCVVSLQLPPPATG